MTAVSIPSCFWCGRDQFDAAKFAGREIRRIVMNYGFCDECRAFAEGKIVCIEVDTPDRTGNPPIQSDPPLNRVSPTGRWMVADRDAFQETPFPQGMLATAMVSKHVMLETPVFNRIVSPVMGGANGGSDESHPD